MTIEVHAVEADVSVLLTALLEEGDVLVGREGQDFVTGRMAVADRTRAKRALLDLIAPTRLRTDIRRTPSSAADAIDIAEIRGSAAGVLSTLAAAAGSRLVWIGKPAETLTLVSTAASARIALQYAAEMLGLSVAEEAGELILCDDSRGCGLDLIRSSRQKIDVIADNVPLLHLMDLLRETTSLTSLPCPAFSASLSARGIRVSSLLASAVAADSNQHRRKTCGTPYWSGDRGIAAEDRLVAVVHAGPKSAALLKTSRGYAVVRPGRFSHGRIGLGPNTIWVQYGRSRWSSSVSSDSSARRNPGDRPPLMTSADDAISAIGSWRLTATVRDGGEWKALLASDRNEWSWIDKTDARVSVIEPGRIVLQLGVRGVELVLTPPEPRLSEPTP